MKFRHLQKSAHYKLNGCFKLVNFWWIFKMTWASQPVKNCDIFLYLCDFQEATRGSLRGGDFLDFSWGIMPQDYGVFWMVSVSNFAKQGFLVCILLRSTCATNRLVPIPPPFWKVSHDKIYEGYGQVLFIIDKCQWTKGCGRHVNETMLSLLRIMLHYSFVSVGWQVIGHGHVTFT